MSEGHQRDREPRPKVTEVPADQANSFAILRRPQVDNDQIPEHAWPRFEGGRIRELGVNPALARRVVTALGEAWVIPGNGYVAMDVGGMTANRTEHAARRGMITWTSRAPDHQNLVHGLVPDGVDEVTLLASNGATTAAVVTENVYGTVLDGPFRSHRFVGPNGPVEFGIG
jgi:hypothetical protein